jgi:hypothetical protein
VANEELRALVSQAAREKGLDPDFVMRIVQAESNWNGSAVSPAGAQGLMQVMPATGADYGAGNLLDPKENVRVATDHLKRLSAKYGGDQTKIAAAYNAGEGRVDRNDGKVPNIAETKNYVNKVAPAAPRNAQVMPPSGRTLSEQEFKAISEKVMASAPAGMDEASFNRWQGPAMAAALAEAENMPAAPEGGAIFRALKGAASQLNPIKMAKGIGNAVMHPSDTTAAASAALKAEQAKAGDMFRQGRYVEAAGHGLAGVIPFLGPAAAAIGEQGASGDVAGMVGAGAGMITAAAAPGVLKTGGKAASGALRAAGAPEALEAAGVGRIADAMTPVTGPNKTRFANMAEKVAPKIAREPGLKVWSRQGLKEGVASKFEEAGTRLDEVADARNAHTGHEMQPVLDELAKRRAEQTARPLEAERIIPTRETRTIESPVNEQMKGQPYSFDAEGNIVPPTSTWPTPQTVGPKPGVTINTVKGRPLGQDVVPGPNKPRVAMIDQAAEELKQLGPQANYDALSQIRKAYDSESKAIYSPSFTADYMAKKGGAMGAADVAGSIRRYQGGLSPETAAENANFHLWAQADDVMKALDEAEKTRPKVGRTIASSAAGSVVGHGAIGGFTGAAIGAVVGPLLDAAMSSGYTAQIALGRYLTELSDAIRRGDLGAQGRLMKLAQGEQIGRAVHQDQE